MLCLENIEFSESLSISGALRDRMGGLVRPNLFPEEARSAPLLTVYGSITLVSAALTYSAGAFKGGILTA